MLFEISKHLDDLDEFKAKLLDMRNARVPKDRRAQYRREIDAASSHVDSVKLWLRRAANVLQG